MSDPRFIHIDDGSGNHEETENDFDYDLDDQTVSIDGTPVLGTQKSAIANLPLSAVESSTLNHCHSIGPHTHSQSGVTTSHVDGHSHSVNNPSVNSGGSPATQDKELGAVARVSSVGDHFDAYGAKINAILATLRAHGLIAT